MVKLYTDKLGLENDRLRRENEYLRKLLNLNPHAPLVIPEEKAADTAEIAPVENIDINMSVLSPTEKISLYRSLFRGRDDVYAIRWEGKNGRTGYSPVCANEWDRRVCKKPKIKCSECPHSSWKAATDQLI